MNSTRIEKVLRTGYKVAYADDKYSAEPWALPTWLRRAHDEAHLELRRARIEDSKDKLEVALANYDDILGRIKQHLYDKLPCWRYDERLGEYGFNQIRYKPTYSIMEKLSVKSANGLSNRDLYEELLHIN